MVVARLARDEGIYSTTTKSMRGQRQVARPQVPGGVLYVCTAAVRHFHNSSSKCAAGTMGLIPRLLLGWDATCCGCLLCFANATTVLSGLYLVVLTPQLALFHHIDPTNKKTKLKGKFEMFEESSAGHG